MVLDPVGWAGLVRVRVDGVLVFDGRNMIMDAALEGVARFLAADNPPDLTINYVAVGTDGTAVSGGDTALGNEVFRKQVTQQTRAGKDVSTELWLGPTDAASQHIKEIGWFASGTATPDSGLLVARVLWDHQKTALESIQISRSDRIGRA